MKKIAALFIAATVGLTTLFASTALAVTTPYQVEIYNSVDQERGTTIRSQPKDDAEDVGGLVDGNMVTIKEISGNGWGLINQGGAEGWIDLQYTKVYGNSCKADKPQSGYITATEYQVTGTGKEGLELRVSPKAHATTFGPIPEGKVVVVQAVNGDWAYCSYNGNEGWANLAHLKLYIIPANFTASVYETGLEGLALKTNPDVNSGRYTMIPEGTILKFDGLTLSGWGHTTFDGNAGWVALRYTKIEGNFSSATPSWGYINPTFCKVINNTEEETMELRTDAKVNSSSFGIIPDDTVVLVEAIVNDWAYLSYNGHKGWGNVYHLEEADVDVEVVRTGDEGLAFKAAADGGSATLAMIPDGTILKINKMSNGWGHTTYEGKEGWVSVRYTLLKSEAEVVAPSKGFMEPKTYVVVNAPDGLALRTSYDGENILLDVIPEGEELVVTAVENNWAYTSYNDQVGWVLSTYLAEPVIAK